MCRLGVATKPIPQNEPTAKTVAAAMKQSVNDENISSCTKRLSERIRSESGVGRAVENLGVFGRKWPESGLEIVT